MPPGNARTRIPVKLVEKLTAEACIAIAQNIQRTRQMAGDVAGSEAAGRVAKVIREELLDSPGPDPYG